MKATLLLLCLGLSGCALIPSSKTSSADAHAAGSATSQHETTLRRATEGIPALAPNIRISVSGTNNSVRVEIPKPQHYSEELEVNDDAGLTSESSFSWTKFSKNVIPWGIKLLLAAAGIFAIIWAIKYARRTSPAIDAAIAAGDRAVAAVVTKAEESIEARIRQHRETAAESTDPSVIAKAQARIAALQEEKVNIIKAKDQVA